MLDIKALNTILFSNKISELNTSAKKIKNSFDSEKAQNILLYAKAYNNSIPSDLFPEIGKLPKIVSDDEIINQFYNSEKNNSFFGFPSLEHLEEEKINISESQTNTVKKNYSKLEIKNKELLNAKKVNDFLEIQKLEQEITKLQNYLNSSESDTALKILKHEVAKEQYIKSFKFSKLVADYIEENNTESDRLAYKHAYDLVICFGGEIKQNQDIISNLQNFLSDKGFLKAPKPLHDTFAAFSIPSNKENVTLKKWQELINKHGNEAMKLFAVADKIELKKAENTGVTNIAPENLQDAKLLQAQLTYVRAFEYPELAELALKYTLSEENFNKCLEVEKQKKKFDNLPNIVVQGKDAFNQYHLVKLPIDDPRAYILGHIVNDCQSIGGFSERCVIDGITRENNGFYVLLKKKNSAKQNIEVFTSNGKIDYQNFDIVGQSYAWLSQFGNLTFDSWENLRNQDEKTKKLNDDAVIVPMLKEWAEQVCETTNINRVSIGLGGKTPKKFHEFKASYPEYIKEGFQYLDSFSQVLIEQKPELKLLQNSVKNMLGDTIIISTLNNAEKLINLVKDYPDFINLCKNSQTINLKLLNLLDVYAAKEHINLETFNSLLNSDPAKFIALIDLNIMKNYLEDYFTFKQILNLETSKIPLLTSHYIYQGYLNNYFTLNDLKNLSLEKIKLVTSREALIGYKKNFFKFNDLKNLNLDLIKPLTTASAITGYEDKYFTFDGIKDLSVDKVKILTSDNAVNGYLKKYFTYDDLKDLNINLVKLLTNTDTNEKYETNYIYKGYEDKYFTFDELKELDIDSIKLLTNASAIAGYEKKYFTFNELKVLSLDKLKIVISVIDYYSNYFTFKEFTELDVKQMQSIYNNIRKCQQILREKYCIFNDLKNVDPNKIKALTESMTIIGYKSKYFTFNDLKDLDIEKIQILTSKDALTKYKYENLKFKDFKKSLEIADETDINSKIEISENPESNLFTNSLVDLHQENVDIIGRDL